MTRATSEQVENVLRGYIGPTEANVCIIADICRDWLDMQARERRLVAVVEAAIEWREAEADESNSLNAQLRIDAANCALIDAIDAVDTDDN
jgi:hypothetical protein